MALTKAEIVAKLEEAKIEFDPAANKADLLALLPEADRDESSTDTEEKDKKEDGDDEPAKKDGGVAVVLSRSGSEVRTYSKELHGPKYRDLAKEYAKKISGSVR